MTDEALIRAALEERLAAITAPLSTAWENAPFSPVSETPYQRVNLLRAQPENHEMGTSRRHLGILQVTLMYPQSNGPKDAEERAGALAAWFPRGLSLTKGAVVVTIDGTPYVMAGFQDEDRYSVPIRVPYFANISG